MSSHRGALSRRQQVAVTKAEETHEAKRRKKIPQMAQEDGGEKDCPLTEAKTLLSLSENMKTFDNSISSLIPNQHV